RPAQRDRGRRARGHGQSGRPGGGAGDGARVLARAPRRAAGGDRARVPAGDDAEPDLRAPGSTARHREDPHAARPGAAARDGGVADMSAAHEPFDELVAGHVLDALEGEDARRFAAHRAGGCAECERAIGEYHEALARLAADFRRQLDEQEKTLTLVRAQAAAQERTLALLGDPETRLVSLAGLEPRPQAQGRIIWNARAGGLLVAADLPPPPAGKVYELWAIAGGKPLPAGLFTVDAEGKGSLAVAPLAGVATVEVFAVTLEPAEGVQSPTGAMYLASKK